MPHYCYDLHVHSKEVSPCAKTPVPDLIRQYLDKNYDGIVLTDHFRRSFWDGEGDWAETADRFLAPWRAGRELGGASGFWVGLGMEILFDDSPNDILLYGFSPELFLEEGREWPAMGLAAFYRRYRDEILIIQAHPNRWDSSSQDDPRFLHGVELYNANPRHDSHNEVSLAFAREHPGMIFTAGSDSHQPGDPGLAGIVTDAPVRSGKELAALLKSGEYKLAMGSHAFPPYQKPANPWKKS